MNAKTTAKTKAASNSKAERHLGRAQYSAIQFRSAVRVTAIGVNPTMGYFNTLDKVPIEVFPPEYRFLSVPPQGPAGTMVTPFQVSTAFPAMETVDKVIVHDADGRHEVKVSWSFGAPVYGKDGPFPRLGFDQSGISSLSGGSDPWPFSGVVPWPWSAFRTPEMFAAQTSGWKAWINRMPPGPASIHVVGEVVVPNPGVEALLTAAVPQGINPRILLLQLTLHQRPGFWPQIVTSVQASFNRVLGPKQTFDSVQIVSDGEEVATIGDIPIVQ